MSIPGAGPGATSYGRTLSDVATRLPTDCAARVVGNGGVAPAGITHDSRAVAPDTAFACVRGEHHDGHAYAASAVSDGATALVVDHELSADELGGVAVPQLVVADVRRCLGYIAAALADDPSHDLVTVGVTGTNGKTTTVALLASILDAAGLEAGVIGTLTGGHTTPEAPELQRRLDDFRRAGKRAAVMEVSSHALEMHRVSGTRFAAAVFTNLGRDHLDLHGSIDDYFRAKARLFTPEFSRVGVVNADDPHGRSLIDLAGIDVIGFRSDDATDVVVTARSVEMTWRGVRLRAPIGGHFNVANVLAAATTAEALGVDRQQIAAGLAAAPPVAGRVEHVRSSGARDDIDVLVDYAHEPDALAAVLASVRRLVAPPQRVIVAFGCGGDRDHSKRPQMGATAAAGADMVIVTSDNPRSEPPEQIIDAIVSGVPISQRQQLIIEPDRRAAIGRAIGAARPGDVVVIAGKGHETTQVVGGTTIEFDDRLVAAEALAARGGGDQ